MFCGAWSFERLLPLILLIAVGLITTIERLTADATIQTPSKRRRLRPNTQPEHASRQQPAAPTAKGHAATTFNLPSTLNIVSRC